MTVGDDKPAVMSLDWLRARATFRPRRGWVLVWFGFLLLNNSTWLPWWVGGPCIIFLLVVLGAAPWWAKDGGE